MVLLQGFQQQYNILAFGKFSLLLGKEGRSAFGTGVAAALTWWEAGKGLHSLARKQKQVQAQTMLTGVRGNDFRTPYVLLNLHLNPPGSGGAHWVTMLPGGTGRQAMLQKAQAPTRALGWQPATLSPSTLGEMSSKLGVGAS